MSLIQKRIKDYTERDDKSHILKHSIEKNHISTTLKETLRLMFRTSKTTNGNRK